MQLASVDGAIGPAAEARIPVTDEGLLRGDGAFEVMRLYAGRPFALEDHYARLARTCAGLRLEPDAGALRREVAALLERAGPAEGLLRLVLTRGGRRIALVEPLPRHAPVARVATIPYAPGRVLDGLKTLSYAANMLATRLAKEGGFDEALLVTPHGRVLEGPTWSFFWVRAGQLLTPPQEDRILASITRRCVIDETDALEQPCALEDLHAAQEAFIASTVREILPIAAIDDLQLPAAPGPVTLRTREALARRIERELGAPA
jgi:branched-chain amino acid aminotransferase